MLSSALMAVLITATPAHRAEPAHLVAQIKSACNAQGLDRKFVRYVEKTPSEKDAPGFRLIGQTSPGKSFMTADDASSCVTELTRLDLAR
jgi:hypothetical protein